MAENKLLLKGFAWLVCCAISCSAWAGRPVRVYEVDLKGGQSPASVQDAMREALVRTTGRRESATDPALANIVVPLANPGLLHRLLDPDVGDTLLVVTAPPPVRGFIKRQDFVDFALLDSAHGIAMRPNSDEVAVELAPDKVLVGKPGGLTLSSVDAAAERAPTNGVGQAASGNTH